MQSPGPVVVEFRYKPADIERAVRLYQTTKPSFWIGALLALSALVPGTLALFGATALYLYSVLNRQPYPAGTGRLFVWSGIELILLGSLIWFDPVGFVIRRVRFLRNPGVYGFPVQIQFAESGVSSARHASRATHEWRLFSEAIEGPAEFLLCEGRGTAFIVIPKRALREGDEEALRAMLMARIGKLKLIRWVPPYFER